MRNHFSDTRECWYLVREGCRADPHALVEEAVKAKATPSRPSQWQTTMVGLSDEEGQPIANEDCPIAFAIASGVQQLRRLKIMGRNGEKLAVDIHSAPILWPGDRAARCRRFVARCIAHDHLGRTSTKPA